MSSHSLYDRSHPSASASSSSSRQQLSHPPPASARRTSYSSLNEALGSTRQPEQPYPHQFHPSDTPIAAQMSSDGRYMYQHPPGMSSYEYPPNYSSANYNPPQFPQNPPRAPPRTASAQSQSPSQQAYNPPQPPYHQPYGSASYSGIPPPPSAPPPQWNGEGWSQYGQPFSAPPIQEAPVVEGQGRPEPAPSPAVQRAYPPPVQASPDVHRNAEPAPAVAPSPQPKRKQREQEPPRPLSPPSGLDFRKLLESYRVIIDTTRSLATDPSMQGRPPPPDALHRMLQSAHYGFQVLGAAAGPPPAPPTPTEPPPPPPVPVPVPAPAKAGEEGEGVAVKRQKSEGPVPEGQTCLGCNATSTPEWRRGPLGPRTLCNACGLVYAKLIKKRNREAARKAGARGRAESGSVPPDESGAPSSGEEDEDSYTGSQEFRSELGDHGGR